MSQKLMVIAMAVLGLLATEVARANLLSNSSFDDGTSGLNFSTGFPSAVIPDWSDSGGNGNWIAGTSGVKHSGTGSIATFGNNSFVHQTVAITPGAEYTLGAWFYAYIPNSGFEWGAGNPQKRLEVQWLDAGDAVISTDIAVFFPRPVVENEWHYLEGNVTAPVNAVNGRVRLGRQDVNAWAYAYMDDVSMVLVPEPASLALLGLGGLALLRRRAA